MANALRTLTAVVSLGLLVGLNAGVALAVDLEDSTPPSDVENLQALPGDGEITLKWDPATDDTGVEGYYVYSGLSSVTEEGGSYTFGSIDTGDDSSTYVMDKLSNGVTYYFAVTAYDAAGNESEYYSFEVEATPESAGTGDYTAPTVLDASALTSTIIEVEFSEAVTLPVNGASAFSLESTAGNVLEVLDAYPSDDPSVIFVITDVQTAGAQYLLTASSSIEDESGNPVVSGTSDTAIFTGSSLDAVDNGDDDVDNRVDSGFVLSEVEADLIDELTLVFSEDVSDYAIDSFTIQLLDDASVEVEVLEIEVNADDASELTLITEEMEPGMDYVLTLDEYVVNGDGDSLAVDGNSMEFQAPVLNLADLIAPEDITNLLASIVSETEVTLSWTASVDSADDLAEYLIYKSTDGGASYGNAIAVDEDATSYDASGLAPGMTYTFKVTAVDENGNESDGVLTTVTLPESGPGMAALFGLSLAGAGVVTRRRRR